MILLETLTLNPTPRRPVWIMRQAGRYMASFRKMREQYSFWQICDSPDLALEVSLLPIKQYELDAAIVFSDILLPLRAMGAKVEFTESGPLIEAPKTVQDLDRLQKTFNPQESTPFILEALKRLRSTVSKEKAVLGFAGAPFTTLCYLLEGKLTENLSIMKRWMAEQPQAVHSWLDNLANALGPYLEAQVEAGADAVQLFDTWASELSPADYETFALPYARKVLSHVTAPSIYYVNGISGILELAANVGSQALSIDWRINLSEARQRVSRVMALQGNLDPHHLHLPKALLRDRVLRICDSYGKSPGHIFNLGHGIMPSAPEDSLKVVIDAVHEWGRGT